MNCYVEATTRGLQPSQFQITRDWRDDESEGVPNQSPWRGEGVPVRAGESSPKWSHARATLLPAFSFADDDPVFAELGQYHALAATPGALGDGQNWVFIFAVVAAILQTLLHSLFQHHSTATDGAALQPKEILRIANDELSLPLNRLSDRL